MERQEMQNILKEQGFQQTGVCDEKNCIVETGKILGVTHMVAGSIGKLGSLYTCDVRLINIVTSEIQTTATSDCQCTIEMVLTSSIADLAEKLSKEICVSSESATVTGDSMPVAKLTVTKQEMADMVLIPGGTFTMGCTDENCDSDELPTHPVTLDTFWMDKYEVTQSSYSKVMGKNLSYFINCPRCPVESVSWSDATVYCSKVNKRLPTEAEWEYAARSGSEGSYYWGNSNVNAPEYAWFEDNSKGRTQVAGTKKSNNYGLFDMSGNVWEWCNDHYSNSYYKVSPQKNPAGASKGNDHTVRGGSWFYGTSSLRLSNREAYNEDYAYRTLGFRCAKK
jgi:formylglycine-generating enzyme required for sulfatase activity